MRIGPSQSWSRVLYALFLLALCPCGGADAACPLRDYRIDGLVVDQEGTPIAGVVVTTTWQERAAGTVTNERETGNDGRFEARVSFDTYSGRTLTGRDRCEALLKEVTLSFRRSGYRTRQLNVQIANAEAPLVVQLVADR